MTAKQLPGETASDPCVHLAAVEHHAGVRSFELRAFVASSDNRVAVDRRAHGELAVGFQTKPSACNYTEKNLLVRNQIRRTIHQQIVGSQRAQGDNVGAKHRVGFPLLQFFISFQISGSAD